LHLCHEEFKDKRFEIELSWITQETNFEHEMIPRELKVFNLTFLMILSKISTGKARSSSFRRN